MIKIQKITRIFSLGVPEFTNRQRDPYFLGPFESFSDYILCFYDETDQEILFSVKVECI